MSKTLPEPRFSRMLRAGLVGIPLMRYRLLGGEKNLVKEVVAKTISGLGRENLDIEETAELVLYDIRYRQGTNLRAVIQHQAAVAVTRSRCEALIGIRVPTLVTHGTDDDFLPLEHARKPVQLIPGAEYLWLDGVGHQFPYPDMPAVAQVILSHLDGVR